MKKICYALLIICITSIFQNNIVAQENTFTDTRDGQIYKTIKVGEHTWLAENFNYEIKGSSTYKGEFENGEKYGRLYSFNTALKAAPKGWHLATDAEWNTLLKSVGGSETAGKFLKSKTGWKNNGNGIDKIGFGALPGGDRFIDNTYRHIEEQGSWWSVGNGVKPIANRRLMDFENDYIYNHERGLGYKRSARYVKNYFTDKPKFIGTLESLKQYECPKWFQDAKFGIYVHWGVYSVMERDAWYARYMYWEGTDDYKYHLKNYGHPSEFGYKDFIPMWKGENFNPDELVALFKESGAKYVTPCAVHHDNFDLWNSKYHKWNSVNMGPEKDIIGLWKEAITKVGLRFGVTTHLARSYFWMNSSNGSDTQGPMKGVPYDALKGEGMGLYPTNDGQTTMLNPPETASREWRTSWFKRLKQLIDDYEPDHLYFDGAIPFNGDDSYQTGLNLLAHYYNTRPEGVLFHKNRPSGLFNLEIASEDRERSKSNTIEEKPWQTDDSIGPWGYKKGATYMTPGMVVDKIIDIVSKNGNMLLNVPIRADGTLDDETISILKNVGKWFKINREAIYATRPWIVAGEGSSVIGRHDKKSPYTSQDIRFVKKGSTVYAFVMDWPKNDKTVTIKSLNVKNGIIKNIELIGYKKAMKWIQNNEELQIIFPKNKIGHYAHTLKITF
ncbi:alpha-L-fucosidase [Lutibacter citreus]|uniref:alpha-L-fucosidase n=1 Tax=Lutibacter citreus TaxID=2138210 RepID=UPI000DBEA33C|nr:alpha-L-fucosidase [Lutibacter citreus]